MSKGVSISYGDIAPEAKENFEVLASESAFGNKYKENLQKYNMKLYNYASPCEQYQTILDGTAVAFPSNSDTANIGLWSEQLSKVDGTFETPIIVTLESAGQYSSQGFTLTFDTFNGIYAKSVQIQWLRVTTDNITTLDTKTFAPTSARYFCQNKIENFNKVIITFTSINMPFNKLKLETIDYGYGTVFYGEELRNPKITQELDPISSQIAINTCGFTLDSKSNVNYTFQTKQPLTVMYNNDLIATVFVKSSKRKSKFLWEVQAEDYIGLMDNIPYVGGIYNAVLAKTILQDIFTVAKVPYSISEDFDNVRVTGLINYTTCREALMQVAFAIQAVVDTSNSDVVKIFALNETVKQTIPKSRIMQGQSFSDENTITSVELTYHTYKAINETVEAYKAEDSGTGENIIVKFSEPLRDLSIAGGTITKQGTNYAIITANTGCVLTGKKYEHTEQIKRKTNPKVLASEVENIVSITNATLISSSNVDNVIKKCYNYLIKTSTTNLKIIEGKKVVYGKEIKWGGKKWGAFKYGAKNPNVVTYDTPVKVGENLNAETEYLGIVSGYLIKQTFGLSGNILVKDAVLK